MVIELSIDAGFGRVGVRDHGGSGRSVVLLHGTGRTSYDWAATAEALVREGHRVVAVDLPAHGASDVPSMFAWEFISDAVRSVMATLSLDAPLVAGHSVGGAASVRLAVEHGCASAVVNVDGHGLGSPSVPTAFHRRRAELLAAGVHLPPDEGDESWRERVVAMEMHVGRTAGWSEENARLAGERTVVCSGEDRWQRRPTNAHLHSMPDWGADLFDYYARLACPSVVVVCTRRGPSGPLGDALMDGYWAAIERDLDAVSQGNPLLHIEHVDATHNVLLERPTAITSILLSLLRT